jgi:hypothetical protein
VLSEELIATGHREGEAEVVSGRDDSPIRRRGGRGWRTEPDGSAEEKGVEGNMSRALRLLREGPSKKNAQKCSARK